MTENVEVAVVGPELEEGVFGAVPLIDYFLYPVFVPVDTKNDRPLLGLIA